MKPAIQERTLVSSGVEEQASYGISSKDQAHIMRILRDQLYSDKILAVLREYASNAWDANKSIGRGDIPIEINLPTLLQPYLSIKDSGPGLSKHDVFHIYTQYGASTKRDSNEMIGMLGIGSKSAFSYTTSFTITSWHGGKKTIYNASLDEADVGVIQLFLEEPCGPETGIEIKVPVKGSDFHEFISKANTFFKYFNPRPIFNIPVQLEIIDVLSFKSGFVSKNNGSYWNQNSIAILGCVPYRLSNEVFNELKQKVNGFAGVYNVGVFLEEADFSANREELKYTDKTKKIIVKKLKDLADEIGEDIKTLWDNPALSQWEKRIKLNDYSNIGLGDNSIFKKLGIDNHSIDLYHHVNKPANKFKIDAGNYSIKPRPESIITIRDDKRALKGFKLDSYHNTVLSPIDGATPAQVKAIVEQILIDEKAVGLPIQMSSTLPWTKLNTYAKAPNTKHTSKVFVYKHNNGKSYYKSNSDHWSIKMFTPSDDDVFVILDRFIPTKMDEFDKVFTNDAWLANKFNIPFPEIKGYKSTEKKPVDEASCKGKHYLEWQKELYKQIVDNAQAKEIMETIATHDRFSYTDEKYVLDSVKLYKECGLKEDHQIIMFLLSLVEKIKSYKSLKDKSLWESKLRFFLNKFEPEISVTHKKLSEIYPLALHDNTHESTWLVRNRQYCQDWVEYVQLKDLKQQLDCKQKEE